MQSRGLPEDGRARILRWHIRRRLVGGAPRRLSALGETPRLTAEVRDQNGQVMAGLPSRGEQQCLGHVGGRLGAGEGGGQRGSATITATADSASGTAEVTVAQAVSAVAVSPAARTRWWRLGTRCARCRRRPTPTVTEWRDRSSPGRRATRWWRWWTRWGWSSPSPKGRRRSWRRRAAIRPLSLAEIDVVPDEPVLISTRDIGSILGRVPAMRIMQGGSGYRMARLERGAERGITPAARGVAYLGHQESASVRYARTGQMGRRLGQHHAVRSRRLGPTGRKHRPTEGNPARPLDRASAWVRARLSTRNRGLGRGGRRNRRTESERAVQPGVAQLRSVEAMTAPRGQRVVLPRRRAGAVRGRSSARSLVQHPSTAQVKEGGKGSLRGPIRTHGLRTHCQ